MPRPFMCVAAAAAAAVAAAAAAAADDAAAAAATADVFEPFYLTTYGLGSSGSKRPHEGGEVSAMHALLFRCSAVVATATIKLQLLTPMPSSCRIEILALAPAALQLLFHGYAGKG